MERGLLVIYVPGISWLERSAEDGFGVYVMMGSCTIAQLIVRFNPI